MQNFLKILTPTLAGIFLKKMRATVSNNRDAHARRCTLFTTRLALASCCNTLRIINRP